MILLYFYIEYTLQNYIQFDLNIVQTYYIKLEDNSNIYIYIYIYIT